MTATTTWTPSPDQAQAYDRIMAWTKSERRSPSRGDVYDGVFGSSTSGPQGRWLTLGGYAGTGKTTLVGRIALELGGRVAFCAYTGKATSMLRRSLAAAGVGVVAPTEDAPSSGVRCATIHGLMYRPKLDEKTGRILAWQRRGREDMPFDLIVVDEASMVPMPIAKDLASYGIPMLAVGDHGQLPPVGDDTGGLMASPDIRLEQVHRQALDNPIIALSVKVREGFDPMRFSTTDARVQVVRGNGALSQVIEFGKAGPELDDGLILCGTNAARSTLNVAARRALGRKGPAPEAGDVVICLRNNYLGDGTLIANGLRGILETIGPVTRKRLDDVEDDPYRVRADVRFPGETVSLQGAILCKAQFGAGVTFKGFDEIPGNPWSWEDAGLLFDHGHALTVHKAQGSQARQVAVVLEKYPWKPDDRRRWIYTAVTRAQERLMIMGER